MADVTIWAYIDSNGQFSLEDSEGHEGEGSITTKVSAGQSVVWKPKNNGGVKSIDRVYKKSGISGNKNIMINLEPKKNGHYGCDIVGQYEKDAEETYSIKYTTSDEKTHTDDPKMKMVLGSGGGGS